MTSHLPQSRPKPKGQLSSAPELPPWLFMSTRRAEPGGTIRLILAGELDLAANLHFEATLDAAQADSDRVMLDLSALTLIDCSGLGTVYAAAERARREGTALILLEPRGQVRRLLGLVGRPPGVSVLDRGDLRELQPPVAA